jgi:hypothetical protein
MMSDTITLPPQVGSVAADNTVVPADVQKQLQDYWRQFGPYHGDIVPTTEWDGGSTRWDVGATIWVK